MMISVFCIQRDTIGSAKVDLYRRKNIPLPPHIKKQKVKKVSTALCFLGFEKISIFSKLFKNINAHSLL